MHSLIRSPLPGWSNSWEANPNCVLRSGRWYWCLSGFQAQEKSRVVCFIRCMSPLVFVGSSCQPPGRQPNCKSPFLMPVCAGGLGRSGRLLVSWGCQLLQIPQDHQSLELGKLLHCALWACNFPLFGLFFSGNYFSIQNYRFLVFFKEKKWAIVYFRVLISSSSQFIFFKCNF